MTVLGLSFNAAVETLYVFVSINGSIMETNTYNVSTAALKDSPR
ncbi:unnamed protein product, partial [Staurois parvus]